PCSTAYEASATVTEQQLAAIWS
ncbi:MAG: hypothetical protein UZ03_NOB001002156, partial [Nitrospira sp. OLB3]